MSKKTLRSICGIAAGPRREWKGSELDRWIYDEEWVKQPVRIRVTLMRRSMRR